MKKLQNILDFFQSTLLINLAVCLLFVVFAGVETFFLSFLSLGFIASIFFKEKYRKNEYLFYFNNGVSKLNIIVFSYFMTIGASVLLGGIVFLIKRIF